MRVLLLGKYPPCQGGIAAKTYWLSCALAKRGVIFDVVTMEVPHYHSEAPSVLPADGRLRILRPEAPPWFLPGGDLAVEKMVAAALELADSARPNIVEANYLAPFGMAAFVVSRLLDVPLVLRHAGSDISKLLQWMPVKRSLLNVATNAKVFVSSQDMTGSLASLLNGARFVTVGRYIPDPSVFHPSNSPSATTTLLVAGKLNYHWRLKALDTLLEVIRRCCDWSLLMVADGIGMESFRNEVEKHGLNDRVQWHPFVPPEAMPALLSGAAAVWAVERPGGVVDISNLIWEAAAAGRPVLVSSRMAKSTELRAIKDYPGLITVNADSSLGIAEALDRLPGHGCLTPPDTMPDDFDRYLRANLLVYQETGEE